MVSPQLEKSFIMTDLADFEVKAFHLVSIQGCTRGTFYVPLNTSMVAMVETMVVDRSVVKGSDEGNFQHV